MDGLALAANIIAVVDIAVKVGSICHEYLNSLKQAESDINRFLQEIQAYQSVLDKLQQVLQSPDGVRLSASQDLKQMIENSHLELVHIYYRLDQTLNNAMRKNTMSFFSSRTLKWPFEKKELDMMMANLDRQKQTISLALTIDHTKETMSIGHKIDLSHLPSVQGARFDSHNNEHDPLCLLGTRTEILASIERWIEDPHGHCIYWLHGLAGTGKSTISRTVALEFSKTKVAVATFFFKKGEGDRARTAFLFATIAHQLVYAMPEAAPFIQQAVENNPHISDKVLSYQFQELILAPLAQVKTNSYSMPAIVVILDALDECDDQNHVTTLISLLPKAKEIRSVRLRFFVTSRPELPIQLGFNKLGGEYENVALHEVPEQDIRRDISTYFEAQLERIRKKFNSEVSVNASLQETWPPKNLVAQLIQISVPLFIFASTVCRFIDDRDSGSPAIQANKFLFNYRNMDESSQMFMTYLPILNQMLVKRGDSGLQSRSASEKTAIIERFRHIVGSMIVLADPLSAESLSRILGVELATVDMEFNKLRSVLNVPTDPSVPVRLFHLSFRDFLVKVGNEVPHPFQVDEQKTHEALAFRCLELLSRDNSLREDICELRHPGIFRSDIDQSRVNACVPPCIRYACSYWVHHLKQSGGRICDGSPAHVFLTIYLLNWLEVLSLLDRISESIGMIDDLMSIVEDSTGHQVSELLYDIKRVVLSNRYIIDTAPLQLYSSVLLFSPQNSVVVKYYKKAIPDWIDLQPAVEYDWDPFLQTVQASGPLVAAIFSRDSLLMATVSANRAIQIWCTNTGACIQEWFIPELREPTWSLNLCFSSDGGLLYLATGDGDLHAWHTDTWEYESQVTLIAFPHTINEITFSDDVRLISFVYPRRLELYEVNTGKCLTALKFERNIHVIAYSPDLSLLLAQFEEDGGGHLPYVGLWNIRGETQDKLLDKSARCAAFSPDLNVLVVIVDRDLEIYMFSGNEYKKVNSCACPTSYERIAFSPDLKLIAAIGQVGIHVFKADTLQCIQGYKKFAANSGFSRLSVSISHDSRLLMATQGSLMSTWDLSYNQNVESWDNNDEYNEDTNIHFSADFEFIIYRRKKSCQIFTAKAGVCLESINTEEAFGIRNCPWAILADDRINIWHCDEENRYRTIKLPDDISERQGALPLFLSQDFALLAAIMSDSICIWDSNTGVLILREEAEERDITFGDLEFSPDSSLVVLDTADGGGHLTLWRVSTGKIIIKTEARFIGFSPDSTFALIYRDHSDLHSGFLEILYTATGSIFHKFEQLGLWRSHKHHSFSQGCSLLALSSPQSIEIWSLETKSLVQCVQLGAWAELGPFTSNNMRLITDFGVVRLGDNSNSLLDVGTTLRQKREKTWNREGLGLSHNFRWILWNEEKLLWIPVQYGENVEKICQGHIKIKWSPSRLALENPRNGLGIIGLSVEKVSALYLEVSHALS